MKGFIWLTVIVAAFVFTKHTVDPELLEKFEPVFNKTYLVYGIYCLSEVLVGIIPPELFLIWALRSNTVTEFIGIVWLLTIISYAAGIIAFGIGKYMHHTPLYEYLRTRFLKKAEKLLQTYGQYLVLVASLTPIPFSGTAMLVGAVDYPFKNYALISLMRFIRFALSAWVIWEANRI
ncbi:MAG: VTT domain-containing protein [Bacteroidales bacterium]|nr:VTT domain-containing protein [Bacteroidales bacterium]